MPLLQKEELIAKLRAIREQGWIENQRPGNAGGVGNTLEDLLGVRENNLPIANGVEWELKSQREDTSALITLFHKEPLPRRRRVVPHILLPKYGWSHGEAGKKYHAGEMSFRQTINAAARTDRGFGVEIDENRRRVVVSFDARTVAPHHEEWLASVEARAGLGSLDPAPYWELDDLFRTLNTKLKNCFLARAAIRREGKTEYYHYHRIFMLQGLSLRAFIRSFKAGNILVDFDARTGHNHGTKFRVRPDSISELYDGREEL